MWRNTHVAVHRAIQRSVVMARSITQKVALLLLTLMVCMPISPSCSLALNAIEPVAMEASASSRPRYYEQALPTALVTETAMPAVALRLPGLDGMPMVRRKTSFVTAAVQAVGPAVVRIDTERLIDRPALEGYLMPGPSEGPQRKEAGQGSGVILSEDGARL
jgi:S1-C subfamily serine protease